MKPGLVDLMHPTQPLPAEVEALIALYNAGQYGEAENRTRALVEQYPDFGFGWKLLGGALQMQGKYALPAFQRVVELMPDDAEAHFNLGVVLKSLGQLDNAVASYRRAVALKPEYAEAHSNLGNVFKDQGRLDDAIASYRRALEIKPDSADTHNNLGTALKDLGRLEGAVASYLSAVALRPDFALAYYNLGNAQKDLGKLDAAVTNYRRAVGIRPDFADAHNNLGTVLKNLGRLDEAAASYRRVLELKPDFAEAYSNLGVVLKELGQLDVALDSYRRALELKPDFADASLNCSILLFLQGRYSEAWPKFEARYHHSISNKKDIKSFAVSCPQWHGESLAGKSLVIRPEQGYGDEIQFARYIPMLKSRSASRITLVCKAPLKALLETLDGVDAVVSQADVATLPPHDYWAYCMSLPLHFATTVDTIPSGLPYLGVLPDRLDRWRARLPAGGFKVGLVWKGSVVHYNDAHRSLPGLATLAPLWSVPEVTFISLQKERGEEEAASPLPGQPIVHVGSDIRDFADTAAIIAQLDLVICVDTAIAHLAGALNKTCWVLLPATQTDWRWFRDRTDSPWYPGAIRLFRQTKTGGWAEIIGELAQELEIRRELRGKSGFK